MGTDLLAMEGYGPRHNVYVIELDKAVLHEPKFVKKNPSYVKGKECYYVGATGLEPSMRFQKHKDGIKHNVYAQKYGIRLVPSLYEKYNPMSFDDAEAKEKWLAEELRKKGFAVWSA
jgi:predicted GIY-YIG superfamily endonuclease